MDVERNELPIRSQSFLIKGVLADWHVPAKQVPGLDSVIQAFCGWHDTSPTVWFTGYFSTAHYVTPYGHKETTKVAVYPYFEISGWPRSSEMEHDDEQVRDSIIDLAVSILRKLKQKSATVEFAGELITISL